MNILPWFSLLIHSIMIYVKELKMKIMIILVAQSVRIHILKTLDSVIDVDTHY
jgi:hypothetical protein